MSGIHFKIAIRALKKNKLYTMVNLVGLALGLATFITILLFINREYSYDTWNPNKDRFVRINIGTIDSNTLSSEMRAVGPSDLGPILKEHFKEVENYSRFFVWEMNKKLFRKKDRSSFYSELVMNTDSTFFQLFPFEFIYGSSDGALKAPNSIVLEEKFCKRLFGEKNPVGQLLNYNASNDLVITGVVRLPEIPQHFDFEAIKRLESTTVDWDNHGYYCYALLKEGTDKKALEQKMSAYINTYKYKLDKEFHYNTYSIHLENVTDIYLHGDKNSQIGPMNEEGNLYLFFAFALLVLLIACINFTNLSVAQSAGRAKEVGVKKVLGISKFLLSVHYIRETFLQVLISLLLSLILVEFFIPFINNALATKLSLFHSGLTVQLILQVVGIVIMVGLLAGVYPAFILSRYQPAKVLKGDYASSVSGKWLRKILVIFQFSTAGIFLIYLFIIHKQFNYMQSMPLGFSPEQVIRINTESERAQNNFGTFKQELLKLPEVKFVSRTNFEPGNGSAIHSRNNDKDSLGEYSYEYNGFYADKDYFEALNMKLIQGRFFDGKQNDSGSVIINEAAVKSHQMKQPIGHRFAQGTKVIGVVNDHHQRNLKAKIEPMAFFFPPNSMDVNNFVIRLSTKDYPSAIKKIEKIWNKIEPDFPMDYVFLDKFFGRRLERQMRVEKVFFVFSIVTLLISTIGLFALSAFVIHQRRREIALRKVLGATDKMILTLLVNDFLRLIVISAVIAAPLAYIIGNGFLSDFAYRVNMPFEGFVLVIIGLFSICFITILFQARKASLTKPISSLKYE
jgi:putative ABC transport system permease protein